MVIENISLSFDPRSILVSNGLRRSSGYIHEDQFKKLMGRRNSRCLYREMEDNEPIVGGSLYFFRSVLKSLDTWFDPSDKNDEVALRQAQYIRECAEDMSHTMADFFDNGATSMLYGFKLFEIVYKRRAGENRDPRKSSRFNDNGVGWRKFMPISPHAVDDWLYNADEEVCGVWIDGSASSSIKGRRLLPLEKAIHIVAIADNENPEGRSVYKTARKPYCYKKRLEEIEAITIERGNGYPVVYVPQELFVPVKGSDDPLNTAAVEQEADRVANLSAFEAMVKDIRKDEKMGVVFPAKMDCNGKPTGFDLELLTPQGAGGFSSNIDTAIKRHTLEMAESLLIDLFKLGGDGNGNRALGEVKLEVTAKALTSLANNFKQQMTSSVVPRLLKLNGMDLTKIPVMRSSEIKPHDLKDFGEYLKAITVAGVPLNSEAQRKAILDKAGLPDSDTSEMSENTTDGIIPSE